MKKNKKTVSFRRLIAFRLCAYVLIAACAIFVWDCLWGYIYSEHRYKVEMAYNFAIDFNEYETIPEDYLKSNGAGIEVLDDELKIVESKGVGVKTDYQYTPVELAELLLNDDPKIHVSSEKVTNAQGATYTIVLHQNILVGTLEKLQKMAYFYAAVFLFGCGIILLIILFIFVKSIYKPIHNNLTFIKTSIAKTPYDKSKADVSKATLTEAKDVIEAYNSMIDEMETIRKDKDVLVAQSNRLISNLSHDLKSPITTLKGYSEVLMKENISPEEQKKYLGYINTNTSALGSMVDLLFEQVKFQCEDYSLNLENRDMNSFLRDIAANYYMLFDQRGFNVNVNIMEEPYFMDFDAVNMRRVFANLLENCLSHNSEATDVEIATAMEWGYYVIYIKDNGVGIPQNDRETVFEPFYQGDLSRTKQHSGLGLYVARQIIEKHNGTIKLFQEEDYKVVFKIFFKIAEQN